MDLNWITFNLSERIAILLLGVGVFLLLREFWCWYWKIDAIVRLLEETVKLLRKEEKNT